MTILWLGKLTITDGAVEGIRTPDPRITNAMLYQLSYDSTDAFITKNTTHSTRKKLESCQKRYKSVALAIVP